MKLEKSKYRGASGISTMEAEARVPWFLRPDWWQWAALKYFGALSSEDPLLAGGTVRLPFVGFWFTSVVWSTPTTKTGNLFRPMRLLSSTGITGVGKTRFETPAPTSFDGVGQHLFDFIVMDGSLVIPDDPLKSALDPSPRRENVADEAPSVRETLGHEIHVINLELEEASASSIRAEKLLDDFLTDAGSAAPVDPKQNADSRKGQSGAKDGYIF